MSIPKDSSKSKKTLSFLRNICSETYTDPVTCAIYSQDASIYELSPQAVVVPRSAGEIQKVVKGAQKNNVSITPRGAGTNTTGSAIGSGIVFDMSKHLRSVRSFDHERSRILVETGIVQDELNSLLQQYGLRLGPDTSTGDRATIGGMIGCNSAGARSLRFGSMHQAILGIELTLSTGEILWLSRVHERDKQSHPLFDQIFRIAHEFQDDIRNQFPAFERSSSGYQLRQLLNLDCIDFAKLIAGSEGTLGVITAAELQLVPLLPKTKLFVYSFASILDAMEASSKLIKCKPISLELIDQKILSLALENGYEVPKNIPLDAGSYIICEVEVSASRPSYDPLNGLIKQTELEDPQDIACMWSIRKGGLGLLLSTRSSRRAIGFIEDMAVDPKKLPLFYQDLSKILELHKVEAGIYGHIGAGCLHLRPFFNLAEDRKLIETMSRQALDLVKKYRGVFSSEHGDGLVRSWASEELFGSRIMQALKEVKKAFDPHNLMNPGKVIPQQKIFENLREKPTIVPFKPQFRSHQRGGIEATVDMCNGNGSCRKMSGTMCPSYQATLDEKQTTRARALALKGVFTGQIPLETMVKNNFEEVFDLCISCKGCAHDCPSHIDASKLKAEWLNYLHQTKGASLRSRFFAKIGTYLDKAAYISKVSNWFTKSLIGKSLFYFLNIDSEALPQITQERFSTWAQKEGLHETSKPDVLLFSDTYTEFFEPEIGKAAVFILQKLQLRVRILPWKCCGRAAISKGFLDVAKKQVEEFTHSLEKQLDHLPLSDKTLPIIVLEPSCLSVFLDEGPDFGNDNAPLLKQQRFVAFEEFISGYRTEIARICNLQNQNIAIHVHCHQKSLCKPSPLIALPKNNITLFTTGCCGMAGSFGYELEHLDISRKIFERDLGSKIDAYSSTEHPDYWIVANGVSCRAQIKRLRPNFNSEQGPHRVLHLAQFLEQQYRATQGRVP